jgi:hypothetical protein
MVTSGTVPVRTSASRSGAISMSIDASSRFSAVASSDRSRCTLTAYCWIVPLTNQTMSVVRPGATPSSSISRLLMSWPSAIPESPTAIRASSDGKISRRCCDVMTVRSITAGTGATTGRTGDGACAVAAVGTMKADNAMAMTTPVIPALPGPVRIGERLSELTR